MRSETKFNINELHNLKLSEVNNNFISCCTPFRCFNQNTIEINFPKDSIKIRCSNKQCRYAKYMHISCFEIWQDNIVSQVHYNLNNIYPKEYISQTLWKEHQYDLNIPICQCKCKCGFLKRESYNYFVSVASENKNDMLWKNYNMLNNIIENDPYNHPHRFRKESLSSSLSLSSFDDNSYSPMNSYIPNFTALIQNGLNKESTTGFNTPYSIKKQHLNNNMTNGNYSSDSMDGSGTENSSSNNSTHFRPFIKTDNNMHYQQGRLSGDVINNIYQNKSPIITTTSPLTVNNSNNQQTINGSSFYYNNNVLPLQKYDQKQDNGTGNSMIQNDSLTLPLVHTICPFPNRSNYEPFNRLPRSLVNSFHVKMEDEGPHGNDETRYSILSRLSALNRTQLSCVICACNMTVYDRYPLIDGVLFLSPVNHYFDPSLTTPINNKNNQSTIEAYLGDNKTYFELRMTIPSGDMSGNSTNQFRYLNAICLDCSSGAKWLQLIKEASNLSSHFSNTGEDDIDSDDIITINQLKGEKGDFDSTLQNTDWKKTDNTQPPQLSALNLTLPVCRYCQTPWDGSRFTVGTLYSYDVLNSSPCCNQRSKCNMCSATISPVSNGVQPSSHFNNCSPKHFGFEQSPYGQTTNGYPSNIGTSSINPNQYYTHYSRRLECPFCNYPDFHFVKKACLELINIPLPSFFVKWLCL
ncbi:unnamed protein product [Gordionus sp. m RMFG-2023]|uniref:probable serine/threonine-protein kinase DDB_G0276461 n=1 Tax=Gordionus sp. m RMFG-2023 TaxID=3053472 RepID=UPI0030DE9FB9